MATKSSHPLRGTVAKDSVDTNIFETKSGEKMLTLHG